MGRAGHIKSARGYVGPLSRRPSTRTTVSLARWPIVMAKNVSVDQTKANQERELRKLASRMGCEIVHVYEDHRKPVEPR